MYEPDPVLLNRRRLHQAMDLINTAMFNTPDIAKWHDALDAAMNVMAGTTETPPRYEPEHPQSPESKAAKELKKKERDDARAGPKKSLIIPDPAALAKRGQSKLSMMFDDFED